MSKEMTPKEAIQMIQDNLTPRTLGILTVEFNVVEKALERLEQLEIADRNNQNLVKTNVDLVNKNLELQKENQELKEKAKKYDEIVNLKTTPNVIEKSLADYMNKCIALEKENQDLKLTNQVYIEESTKLIEQYKQLKQENQGLKNKNVALKIKVRAWEIQSEKFKKIIDILKNKANIRLHILTNTDGSKIYEIEFILGYYSTIYEITQQEYDLLKEVLENV